MDNDTDVLPTIVIVSRVLPIIRQVVLDRKPYSCSVQVTTRSVKASLVLLSNLSASACSMELFKSGKVGGISVCCLFERDAVTRVADFRDT